MKKRYMLFSLLLAFVLALTIMPSLTLEANAAVPTKITVIGQNLGSGWYMDGDLNVTTKKPSDNYLYYNNGVLTMKNFARWITTSRIISSTGDLTINLEGENTLVSEDYYAIFAEGKLTFQGSGMLYTSGTNCCAIRSNGDMIIDADITVDVTNDAAMYVGGNLSLDANLISTSSTGNAINCRGNFNAMGGSAKLTGKGTVSPTLYVNNELRNYNCDIDVESVSTAVYIGNGSLRHYGGSFTAISSASHGLYAYEKVYVQAGFVRIEGALDGIRANTVQVYSGELRVSSKNTANDSSYCAVRVYSNTTTYFDVRDYLCLTANTGSNGANAGTLQVASLADYDYVYLADKIEMRGISVYGGQYLASDGTAPVTTKPSGGYAYYSGGVLTLNNYSVKDVRYHGVYAYGDLTVKVVGNNKLETGNWSNDTVAKYGLFSRGNMTIQGDGTLNVYGGNPSIYCLKNLNIDSTTLNVTENGTAAIYAYEDIKLNSVTLNAQAIASPVIKGKGALNVTDSSLVINTDESLVSDGISIKSGVTMDGSNVQVTSTGDGIVVSDGNITINSGTVTVNAGSRSFFATNIYIKGGYTKLYASTNAVYADRLYVTGGVLQASVDNALVDTEKAICVAANNDSYINIANGMNKVGSTGWQVSSNPFRYQDVNSYRFVCIGDFVVVRNVILPKEYYLPSGSTAITNTKPSGGYAYYYGFLDGEAWLTVHNYVHNASGVKGIVYDGPMQIMTSGSNSFTSDTVSAVEVSGNLLVGGTGTLTVNSAATALHCGQELTITAPTTAVSTAGNAVYCGGMLLIEDEFLNATASAIDTYAIVAGEGVQISVGTLTAKSFDTALVITEGDMIIGGGTVTMTSSGRHGASINGKLTVTGGTVNVSGYLNGIETAEFEISGGKLTSVSTTTTNDSSYSAFRVPNYKKFVLVSPMVGKAAWGSSGSDLVSLDTSNLVNYDRVIIEKGEGPVTTTVTVSGTVTSFNSTTDTVTVKLIKGGTAVYTTTCTGNSAAYSITGVTAGTYTLEVSKKNHVTREYKISVTDGSVTQDVKIHLKGDVDGSGSVNMGDFSRIYAHVKKTTLITDAYMLLCADATGDGKVNMGDFSAVYAHVKKTSLLW